MNKNPKSLLTFSLFFAAMGAQAQYVSSGTSSFVTTRNCIAGCSSISTVLEYADGGAPGQSASAASLAVAGYGEVSASAALTGVLGTPLLNAAASSTSGTREGATAYALQSYTYTGSSSRLDTFGGTVNYSQTMTGSYSNGSGTGAAIEIFTLNPGALFNAGTTSLQNFQALADAYTDNTPTSGTITQAGFTQLGFNEFSDSKSNAAGTGSTDLSVMLHPGETIWVLAAVTAIAPNGSAIDPTFKATWSDSANLVTGVGTVRAPEIDPASTVSGLMLLIGGLLVCRGRWGAKLKSVVA
jgi:hypothetical protein